MGGNICKFIRCNIKEYKFKIQEGTNIFDLKEQLLSSALTLDCPNFDCLSNQFKFIEGTLMPETYFYNFRSPASNILIKSQNSFLEYADYCGKKKQLLNPIKTLDEAIILASMLRKKQAMIQKNYHCRSFSYRAQIKYEITG